MTDLRTAAQQALECLKGVARGKYDGNAAEVCVALEAALAQEQAEPVQEPVARDSTLKLAHQAGIVPGRPATAAQLADLVALVRADEREACARIAERSPEKHWCVATIRARSKE